MFLYQIYSSGRKNSFVLNAMLMYPGTELGYAPVDFFYCCQQLHFFINSLGEC
jgi:hypothetical protein